MTTLTIIPNWKNKTARFKGTVAAGEHVAVTIQNDNGEGGKVITDASTLRLRVIGFDGRTLAIFPEPVPEGETPEEWDGDLSPLRCTLNLNTVQMLKAVPPTANVPLLFVLDDYENKTLYFKEQFSVEHWPRLRGEEEPTDLDNYKDIIAEFDARLADAEKNVAIAAENVQIAADAARGARAAAETAATRADAAVGDAQNGAIAAKNFAAAAQTAAESINSPDATLTQEGVAADAKAVGDAVRAEKQRAESAESSLGGRIDAEAQARLLLAATVQTNAATIATHTASLASLSSRVGDNETAIADRYTKSEVDAKVAGVQTFQKLVVNELPSAESADDKTIYLVPRAGSETPDLCDEYVVVGAAGSRRWEKIGGGTAVDLTLDDTVTRTSANGVKSSGIWSAIWGALTALPSGIASLYDWCVAQLAGKASTADATLTPIYPDSGTPTFSGWTYSRFPDGWFLAMDPSYLGEGWWIIKIGTYDDEEEESSETFAGDELATELTFEFPNAVVTASRRRTDIIGYTLGSQSDKLLQPKGDYAPATGIQKSALAQDVQASLDKADTALPLSGGRLFNGSSSIPTLTVTAQNSGVSPFRVENAIEDASSVRWAFEVAENKFRFFYSSDFKYFTFPSRSGTLALLSDIYAAVQQIAPAWVSGTAYMANALVSYNGVVYQNTSGGTIQNTTTPDTSGNGWRAKRVSELFLPLTGGVMDGDVAMGFNNALGLGGSLGTDIWLVNCGGTNSDGVPYIKIPGSGSDANVNWYWPGAAYLPPDAGTAKKRLLRGSEIGYGPFSDYLEYAVNDLVIYDGAIWKCTVAHTSFNGWNAAHFTKQFEFDVAAPASGGTKLITNGQVYDALNGITPGPDNTKLDSTSAAPAFDTTATYAVSEHVTYNGKLYRCTTAVTTPGAWNAANWTAEDMTSPDATLNVTSAGRLRLVDTDGTVLWQQGYDLAAESSATLACDKVNYFAFADAATTQAFVLPAAPSGKVGDFVLDIDNSANTVAAGVTLTGLDTEFSVVVPSGQSLAQMLTFAAGEMAELYFTQTAFTVNNLPTWKLVKQIVENGGAQA